MNTVITNTSSNTRFNDSQIRFGSVSYNSILIGGKISNIFLPNYNNEEYIHEITYKDSYNYVWIIKFIESTLDPSIVKICLQKSPNTFLYVTTEWDLNRYISYTDKDKTVAYGFADNKAVESIKNFCDDISDRYEIFREESHRLGDNLKKEYEFLENFFKNVK